LPPLPAGLWEKIRLPCDERWQKVLASENVGSDRDNENVLPTVVVARIARRTFPTLRNTEAIGVAYRTVPSDAAGMVHASDLKRLIHNLVFINNHWPALYSIQRNSGYDMDLITFRRHWQSFCASPTRADAADKEESTESAEEADNLFAMLMDARHLKTTEQRANHSGAAEDTSDPVAEDPVEERPTRASFDEFISALAMRFADEEKGDDGFAADLEEKLALAAELKIAGNESYKNENWSEAIEHYTRALDAIKACEAEAEQTDLAAVLLSNRAAARGLADRCMDALSDCERCVELAPTYMRGVKRRADCHAALGVWDKSIEDFQAVVDFCAAPASAAASAGIGDTDGPAPPAVDEQTAKLLVQAQAGLQSVEKVRKEHKLPLLRLVRREDAMPLGFL
jgi:tetratricopeptide (TPR) repeat protein